MRFRVVCSISEGEELLRSAVLRYDLLDRLRRCAEAREVGVVAFGFADDELRLVLDGDRRDVGLLLRGLKGGTRRLVQSRYRQTVVFGACEVVPDRERLTRAVLWAHEAPLHAGAQSPLASPWSSHRDLLGYRQARFYDRGQVAGLDGWEVHRALGGKSLPTRGAMGSGREPLAQLLRVAAGVLGVLPSSRRCFRLFVHLAKARGWSSKPVSEALLVTTRRVRQLASEPEPALELALVTLADPRLSRVP